MADLEEGIEEIYSTGLYEWEAAGRLYLQNLTQSELHSTALMPDETDLPWNYQGTYQNLRPEQLEGTEDLSTDQK